jgi:hypothetical protein
MIDEYSIPQHWKDKLASVQRYFPEAIIAGGALRDLDHGREIKDVDIFVLDRGTDTERLLRRAFDKRPEGVLEATDYHVGRQSRPVTGVYDFDWGGTAFQVIVVKPGEGSDDFPRYIMRDFDLGICMTWFDGKTWHRTFEYQNDEQAKVFQSYIPLEGKQLDLTKERVARLSEKYPDFTSTIHYQEEVPF